MGKNSFRYVGKLESSIADVWGLEEHANKPIVIYNDRKQHVIDNHQQDFDNIEQIDYVFNNISKIIKKPDYVYYNHKTKGLEYYKVLGFNILVAIRISFGNTLKIRSFYPANAGKMNNRKVKTIKELEEISVDITE